MKSPTSFLAGGMLLLAMLLLTLTAATPAGARLGPGAVSAAPNAAPEDDLLRELAVRLLNPPYYGPDQPKPTVDLLPGALAPDAPFALPIPPGGRLVGSVARRVGGKLISIETVLDAPGKSADVSAYFEGELKGRGWSPADFGDKGMPQFGFQPTTSIVHRYFCPPQGTTAFLSLNIFPTDGGPNDVRVQFDPSSAGPCYGGGKGEPPRGPLPPGLDKMPALTPPDGAEVSLQGAYPGPNRFSSAALAETAMGVADLEAFYARQLQAAGWTRVAGSANGPLAWSTWRVPGDGGFEGFLYVLQAPGENRRDLYLQIASATPFNPSSRPIPVPAPPDRPSSAPGDQGGGTTVPLPSRKSP